MGPNPPSHCRIRPAIDHALVVRSGGAPMSGFRLTKCVSMAAVPMVFALVSAAFAQQQPTAPAPRAAAPKQAPPPKSAPPCSAPPVAGASGVEPTLLGQYGDWGAYTASPGGRKMCFALAKPKTY